MSRSLIFGRCNPHWFDAISKWVESIWKSYGCPAYQSVEGFIEMVERKVFYPKYDGDYLHKTIKDMVGEKRLHETLTNVIIPTFDVKLLQPVIFSTLKACFFLYFLCNPISIMIRGVLN